MASKIEKTIARQQEKHVIPKYHYTRELIICPGLQKASSTKHTNNSESSHPATSSRKTGMPPSTFSMAVRSRCSRLVKEVVVEIFACS